MDKFEMEKAFVRLVSGSVSGSERIESVVAKLAETMKEVMEDGK